MKAVSRRKFVKGALAVMALLPAAKMVKSVPVIKSLPIMQKDAVLTVDKDGNATLHGMTIAVDKKNDASVM